MLGSRLCERLLDEEWEVVRFDSFLTGSANNLARSLGNPRLRFAQYDVASYLFVEGDLDWVLHYASPASPRDYLDHPIHTLKVGALRSTAIRLLERPVEDPEVRCPDITRAREGLGWEPSVSLREGLARTIQLARGVWGDA